MSGAEAGPVLDLISSVITVIHATRRAYEAIKDTKGLPRSIKKSALKLHAILKLLEDAKKSIETVADETTPSTLRPTLENVKCQAMRLHDLFAKVIPEDAVKLESSLPEGFENAPTFAHHGSGTQSNSIGGGTQNNNNGPGQQYIGKNYLGPRLSLNTNDKDVIRQCLREVTIKGHWCVPRAVNTHFTGRVEIIKRVKSAITLQERSQKQRRFVITGMGGLGKSEICLKVADELREAFWGVFWVDVGSESAATDDFIKIAKILRSTAETIDGARQSLSNEERDWLLILDNADDPDFDYTRYFPSGTRGAILLTSRNNRCNRLSTVGSESLGSLEPADCLSLFYQVAGIEPSDRYKEPAMRIVKLLDSHTLALIQAGAYIAQDFCSVEEYPAVYKIESKRLLSLGPDQAPPRYHNVYATFEASVQALSSSRRENSQDALDMLHLLAVLHYSNLPLELFKDAWDGAQVAQEIPEGNANIDDLSDWHVSQLPQTIQWRKNTWDPFRLQSAQNLLQSLALVQRGEERGAKTVSLHPLVHKWAYLRQVDAQRRQSWVSAGCTIALSYYGTTRWTPYWLLLQLHLHSLLSREDGHTCIPPSSMPELQIVFQCCELMNELRMDYLAREALNNLFHRLKLDPIEPQEEYMPLYKLAGRNLYNVGDVKKGVKLWEKVCHLEELKLAEDHPNRLASQYGLACAYHGNGQVKEAVQLLEHVVKIQKTVLAEDHPDQLTSQHTLAGAYEANGQVKEAIQLLEHVVKVSKTVLAEDHPSRLASQHELAGAYEANGQVKEAVQLLEHVVKVRTIVLAKDHPGLLSSQHELATAYHTNGQIKEAIQLLEHVVKIQKTVLAEDHPSRLASQHALAGAYEANCQVKEAIQLLEHVVKVSKTVLAEDHPSRLASQHELARAYQANGQVKEAVQLLEHVVKVEKIVLAEDHPARLASQNLLTWIRDKHSSMGS
ncbi:hypothetical protein MGYG_04293 [Nannizzia gypsea CBS 118893]|uniref:Uncharacterized protein n=1 Tax=Arthroderma gypseum (strain ATCC MYA-4604 / CBS 118893) TaxID=535722 RepID=E4US84_ARTGP|nr:hypothetical protein MGYG_04293 [Nannizzia gypsea CBS 118893]EFR01288.1 hypothetical protein MGYG_04293 [Nannizzia gypsea CBS 118893]